MIPKILRRYLRGFLTTGAGFFFLLGFSSSDSDSNSSNKVTFHQIIVFVLNVLKLFVFIDQVVLVEVRLVVILLFLFQFGVKGRVVGVE